MRRRGKKADVESFNQDEQASSAPSSSSAAGHYRRGGGADGTPSRSAKDVIHHHPPKAVARDVGYPMRGGQTLLIAYFPWEASEADIEHEFAKFSHVKRVHLVVDKSSRKPRCFGFVKFMTKADAEEALQATLQGLVQLPDTRGHVWHLKAEWTKSGDMVVDDSETEQEVAKRKEERRWRTDQNGTTPILDVMDDALVQARSRWRPAPPSTGTLHPGVPAPLPPLHQRYPASPSSVGMQQGQIPMVQPCQSHFGVVGGASAQQPQASLQGPVQQMLPAAQPLAQSQGVSQPVYPGQQGQNMYSGSPPSSAVYSNLGGGGMQQLPRDGGTAVQTMAQGYAAPAQGYAQQPQGYVPTQQGPQGYAPNQQNFATGSPGYAPQQPAFPPPTQAFASTANGYSAQAFSGYNMGQNIPQQSPYGYMQQAAAAPGHSGVLAYGGYPAGPQPGTPGPSQMVVHQGDDHGQESAALAMTGMSHVVVSPAAQPQFMPATQLAQSQLQCGTAGGSTLTAASDAAYAQSNAGAGVTAVRSDTQYLDLVWHLSEMSLQDKAGMPVQQMPVTGMQQPPVWNSFDDAAAKGMVDGLVGHEDGAAGVAPVVTTWNPRAV